MGKQTDAAPMALEEGGVAVNRPQIVRYFAAETNLCTKDFSLTERQVSNAPMGARETRAKAQKFR